jgi:DNA-binding transcriptional LysR family regulator
MRVRRLFDDGFVTVCRPDHPRLRGALSLEEFLAEGHLLVAPRGTAAGTIDAVLAEQGRARRIVRTVSHFLSALWQVGDDDLLLTVSRRLVAEMAGRITLQVYPTPLPVEDYTLSALWHPRLDQAPEDTWFRAMLGRAAEELVGERRRA